MVVQLVNESGQLWRAIDDALYAGLDVKQVDVQNTVQEG